MQQAKTFFLKKTPLSPFRPAASKIAVCAAVFFSLRVFCAQNQRAGNEQRFCGEAFFIAGDARRRSARG